MRKPRPAACRRIQPVLAVLLALCSVSCGTPVKPTPASNPSARTFPTVSGESLNRREFTFPAGIDAPHAILLVAFYQWQQSDVNTWLPAAKAIIADHANVEYYELPTISGAWGLVRGWIDGGMRSGIPAFADRERTVTLYTDTAEFRRLAGIENPNQIWIALISRDGTIHWTARGRATDETLDDLRRATRAIASPAAPRPSTAG